MNNMPFLKQVARHYAGLSLEDLSKLCFVFPTQRSGFFFNDYFKSCVEEKGERYVVSPLITTFDRQVGDWSGMIKGSQVELQLLLYKTYLEDIRGMKASGKGSSAALEPDRFLYWCELILGDFSDVDMALADPAHLFRNLKDNKELQTLPLDEEQLELVRKFWNTTGVPWLNPEFEADRMWVYTAPDDKNVGVRNFLKLWEVLGPLYEAFNKRLRRTGLAYKGMMYRAAYEILENARNNDMTLEKQTYVFVGLPFLSRAEKAILSTLKKWGKAEFFWDTVMPEIGLDSRFPFRLVDSYVSNFPMPEEFEISEVKDGPEINIYSVPSTIVQAKKAASIISKDKTLNAANATEFAVILPETRLCLPLLSSVSVSDDIGCNISIGFPVKDTPMASLMNVVVQLKATASRSKKGWFVSRQRVEEIATQPILLVSCPRECEAILSRLRKTRGTFVNADEIADEAGRLGFLFRLTEQVNAGDVITNFLSIIDSLIELCEPYTKVIKKQDKGGGEDKEDKKEERNLPREFLAAYREKACELLTLIRKYDLEPALESTPEPILATLEKMMRRMQLSFAGVPLQGVQIMGVMESYLLDFERVIITSMNENSFPKKLQKRTFIPQKLRVAYGLDNMDDEETLNAYYFYRLISRSSFVDLLYNSNTDGLKAGEFSRYIYQLRYLATKARISEQTLDFVTWKPKESPVRIPKDDYAMEQLEAFLCDSTGKKRYLSASSIKKYLNCPLEFYLNVVSGFADEDNDMNHINDSDYGNITHAIMERLYRLCPVVEWEGKKYHKVTVDDLNVLLNDVKINEVADAVVREYYYNEAEGKPVEIEGEAMIFRDMAVDSVVEMLKAEKLYMREHDISHFLFVEAEVKREIELELPSGRKANFRYIIDRVDRMFPQAGDPDNRGYLRIVDYKTGGDKLNFSGIDALVDYEAKGGSDHPKAIMQLLLYSIAYGADKRNNVAPGERIQPLIYSFRNIMENNGHINHLKNTCKDEGKSSGEMLDYNDCKKGFMQKIGEKMDELFDRNKDFIQTTNSDNCQFCRFKSICAR